LKRCQSVRNDRRNEILNQINKQYKKCHSDSCSLYVLIVINSEWLHHIDCDCTVFSSIKLLKDDLSIQNIWNNVHSKIEMIKL
jgi:predicted aldo/keto reductase-like oxidoreductase